MITQTFFQKTKIQFWHHSLPLWSLYQVKEKEFHIFFLVKHIRYIFPGLYVMFCTIWYHCTILKRQKLKSSYSWLSKNSFTFKGFESPYSCFVWNYFFSKVNNHMFNNSIFVFVNRKKNNIHLEKVIYY